MVFYGRNKLISFSGEINFFPYILSFLRMQVKLTKIIQNATRNFHGKSHFYLFFPFSFYLSIRLAPLRLAFHCSELLYTKSKSSIIFLGMFVGFNITFHFRYTVHTSTFAYILCNCYIEWKWKWTRKRETSKERRASVRCVCVAEHFTNIGNKTWVMMAPAFRAYF